MGQKGYIISSGHSSGLNCCTLYMNMIDFVSALIKVNISRVVMHPENGC